MDSLCRNHVEARFESALAVKPAPVACGGGSEPEVKGPAACVCSIKNVRPMDHECLIVATAGSLKHMQPVDLFKANHQIGNGHANATIACCLAMKQPTRRDSRRLIAPVCSHAWSLSRAMQPGLFVAEHKCQGSSIPGLRAAAGRAKR